MAKGICETCTFDATLRAAENIVNSFVPSNHQAALGGVALTRKCLEEVANNIDCTKPIQNQQTGQLDCPLRESAYGARALALGPWNQAQFTVQLEKQAPASNIETTHQTGQYL